MRGLLVLVVAALAVLGGGLATARADSSWSLGVGTGFQLAGSDHDRRGREWHRGWSDGWRGRDWDDDWGRRGWRHDSGWRRDDWNRRWWGHRTYRPYYGYGGYGHGHSGFSTFFYLPLGSFGTPPPPPRVVMPAGPCVQYNGDAVVDATGEPFFGVACLGADGRWHIAR